MKALHFWFYLQTEVPHKQLSVNKIAVLSTFVQTAGTIVQAEFEHGTFGLHVVSPHLQATLFKAVPFVFLHVSC